jgi:hypothetical protein
VGCLEPLRWLSSAEAEKPGLALSLTEIPALSLTDTSIVASNDEAVSCDLAGGVALLDLRTGTYFSINPVGAFVWGLLSNPVAVSDIHKAVLAQYDVEQGKCYSDLMKLLRELAEAGLIITVDAATR